MFEYLARAVLLVSGENSFSISYRGLSLLQSPSTVTSGIYALWFMSLLTEAEQWPVHCPFSTPDYFTVQEFPFLSLISFCLCCVCPAVTSTAQISLLQLCVGCVCDQEPSSVQL